MEKKLSLRLDTIHQHVSSIIDRRAHQVKLQVWDCCCDHGFLGRHILSSHPSSYLHFVDQNEGIMEDLARLMAQYYADLTTRFKLHQLDVHQLMIDHQSGQEHIVILAGIGGKMIVSILEALQCDKTLTHFVLCPQYHSFELRHYLRLDGFNTIEDSYVHDKGRHYEVLSVSKVGSNNAVSATGDFWTAQNKDQQDYLAKLLTHYRHRQSKNSHKAYQSYQALEKQLQSQA